MSAEAASGLWERVATVSRHAEAAGALQPLATQLETLCDQGITFQIRRLVAHRQKANRSAGASNPFLPYDPALYVADIGAAHVALLNKFKVVDRHLLLVTRAYVSQTAPLTLGDFQAASRALAAGPALLFYNGGAAAGASQTHRHLQLVPLPLSDHSGGFPLAAAMGAARLPFPATVSDPITADAEQRAIEWHRFYQDAVSELGLAGAGGGPLAPYNLLATADRIALIPRQCDAIDGISVNALGYAGLLLVKNEGQLQRLKQIGPLALLRQCGGALRV